MIDEQRCPHCGEGVLKSWHELSADEQEVITRLPGATKYRLHERQANHRWCTRCWFEATENSANV